MNRFSILLFLLSATASFAQNMPLRAGQTLVYKVSENHENSILSVRIITFQPSMILEWSKNNAFKDAGSFSLLPVATSTAINELVSLTAGEQIEMRDQLPACIVSKQVYSELKKSGKTNIRLDCNIRAEELVLKNTRKFSLTLEGKTLELDAMQLSYGIYNDEMWILDDAAYPLVLKIKGLSSWELAEIK